LTHLPPVSEVREIPEAIFNQIVNTLAAFVERKQDEYLSHLGCSCFSESNNNILLWSHYGDKHKGMCLEFDTAWNLFSKAFKVNYSAEFPKWDATKMIFDFTPRDGSKDIFLPMLTKSKLWEYEQEWRIFHKKAMTTEDYKPKYLKSIYFGIMTHENDIQTVRDICKTKYKHVNLFKAKKSETRYEIENFPISLN